MRLTVDSALSRDPYLRQRLEQVACKRIKLDRLQSSAVKAIRREIDLLQMIDHVSTEV